MVMTEEQCTHLRGTIAHCRKIGEIGAFTAGGVEDLLDTIDALRAELAALRSAPVAVEVPEPSDDEAIAIMHCHSTPDEWPDDGVSDDLFEYVRWGVNIGIRYTNKRRPIPSDRVLKEGEVAVPVELLRFALDALRCSEPYVSCGYDHSAKYTTAIARLEDAIRSQRAAEGGVG